MRSRRILLILALLSGLVFTITPGPTTHAATFNVTTTTDELNDNVCSAINAGNLGTGGTGASLREAICAANNTAGADIIELPAGTYAFEVGSPLDDDNNLLGDLDILSAGGALTIQAAAGEDARSVIIDGSGAFRVIHNHGAVLTLSGVTIRDGRILNGSGSGIYNDGGTLTIQDSRIEDNSITGLPGIGGSSSGAGIYSVSSGGAAVLNITRSLIEGNRITGTDNAFGGGVYSSTPGGGTATLTISNTTFANNVVDGTSVGFGGAVFNGQIDGGTATASITNSTFSGNRADGVIVFGGGFYNTFATASFQNTIIANSVNGSCSNNAGTFTSLGDNIADDTTCDVYFSLASDLRNTDPELGPLQDNGGPTHTYEPLPGSPVINQGNNSACAAAPVGGLDQRGLPRPMGGVCDIGAVEVQVFHPKYEAENLGTVPPTELLNDGTDVLTLNVVEGETGTYNIRVDNTGEADLDVDLDSISDASGGSGHSSRFSVTAPAAFPFTLTPAAAPQTITVECAPPLGDAGTTLEVDLNLTTNDPYRAAVSYRLQCDVTDAPAPNYVSVSPAPGDTIDLTDGGNPVTLGRTSDPVTITITNDGSADLEISSVEITGANPGDFSFSVIEPLPAVVNPSPAVDFTAVEVRCAPTAVGARSATLRVHHNDNDAPPANPAEYPLACEGTDAPPVNTDLNAQLVADPSAVIDGASNVEFTLTLRNLNETQFIQNIEVFNPDTGDPLALDYTIVSLLDGSEIPGAAPLDITTPTTSEYAETSYTINNLTAADIDPGNPARVNRVLVTAELQDGTLISAIAEANITILSQIFVHNQPDALRAVDGQTVGFTVLVKNLTSSGIGGLFAPNPEGAGNIAFSVAGGPPTTAPFNLSAGEIAIGTYLGTVSGGDPFESTVTVQDGGSISESATGSVEVAADQDVAIYKTADPTYGYVGDDITYNIEVFNQGTESLINIGIADLMLGGDITGSFTTPLSPGDGTQAQFIYSIQADDHNPVINSAIVAAETGSGGQFQATTAAAVLVLPPPTAAMQVLLLPDDNTPDFGQRVSFTVIITNNGGQTLNFDPGDVRANLPDGSTETLSISQTTLDPGETAIASFQYRTAEDDFPSAVAQVTANATAGLNNVNGSATTELVFLTAPPPGPEDLDNLTLEARVLTCDTPCTFLPGETIRFAITLRNDGLNDLGSITLTSSLLGVVDLPQTALASGEEIEFEVEYVVPLGGDETLVLELQANSVSESGEFLIDNLAIELGTVTQARLDLTVAADRETVNDGEDVTYTLTLTNAGSEALTAVAVIDNLIGPIALTEFPDPFPPGEVFTQTYTYTVSLADSDPLTNVVLATASLASGDSDRTVTDTDIAITNIIRPLLLVEAVANKQSANYGEVIEFFVTIYNAGDGTVDNLAGTYAPTSGGGTGGTASRRDPPGGLLSPPHQGAMPITNPTLLQGQATTAQFSYTPTSRLINPLTLRVDVTGQGLTGPVPVPVTGFDEVTIVLYENRDADGNIIDIGTPIPGLADPEVTKEADQPFGAAGGIVVWTVTVRNPGEDPITDLQFTDTLPMELSLEAVTSSLGTVTTSEQGFTDVIDVTGLSMAFNEQAVIVIITRLADLIAANELVTNTGCAESTLTPGAAICDDATIRVAPDAELLPQTGEPAPLAAPPAAPVDSGATFGGWLLALLGAGLLGMVYDDDDDDDPPGGGQARLVFVLVAVFAAVVVLVVIAALVVNLGGSLNESTADLGGDAATAAALAGTLTASPNVSPEATQAGQDAAGETGSGAGSAAGEPTALPALPPTETPGPTGTPVPESAPFDPNPAYERELYVPGFEAFGAPSMPIVNVPLENRKWEVRDLDQRVGFLGGTTWIDEAAGDFGGNTVLAAHVQVETNVPGPFRNLDQLGVGDRVFVADRALDAVYEFEVFDVNIVAANDTGVTFPTAEQTLTLITCTGFDVFSNTFAERLVLRARPLNTYRYE